MRGFWATISFLLGLALVYPGIFIWQLAVLSVILLGVAIAVLLVSDDGRRRAVAFIFAWMSGFVIAAEIGLNILLRASI